MNLLIIRLIIFVVLFWAGLKLYRMYRDWKLEREEWQQTEDRQEGGHMVRCVYCQVHLPEDEALREQGQWFCGTPHRDKYLAEQQPSE